MGLNYGIRPTNNLENIVFFLDATNIKSYSGSGTTWTDLIGSNNGSISGATHTSGKDGYFSFNGSSNDVNLGTFFTYQTFTIELWVNPGTSQVQYANIFDNNHTGFRNFVFQQNSNDLNQYAFGVNDASGSISGSGTITLPSNNWTHVAFTFSPSTRVIAYVNGDFHSQGNLANNRTIVYSSQNLRIGRWGGGGRWWNGKMSNFRVYNKELTAAEVQQSFDLLRGRYGI